MDLKDLQKLYAEKEAAEVECNAKEKAYRLAYAEYMKAAHAVDVAEIDVINKQWAKGDKRHGLCQGGL